MKALNHIRRDGCRQARGILTILVTSQLLMELLMDTEELVSVRPVLPSAPSSSCALTAALTGTQGNTDKTHQEKHVRALPMQSLSQMCHCTYVLFPFQLVLYWTGAADTLLPYSSGSHSFPGSSQQSTEIPTPLHRLLPTLSLNSVLDIFDIFNRSVNAI